MLMARLIAMSGSNRKTPRPAGPAPYDATSTAVGASQGQRPVPSRRAATEAAQPALWYPSGVITEDISSTPAVTVSMLRI